MYVVSLIPDFSAIKFVVLQYMCTNGFISLIFLIYFEAQLLFLGNLAAF